MDKRPSFPLLAALVLAGCASTQSTPPASIPVAGSSREPVLAVPQAAPPVLAAEKHWLQDLFRDTPVTVSAAPDAGVRVQVPLQYSFDVGKDQVKPPLAAVLDKVAASLHRQQRAQLRVAAPAGARAENVRQQLLKRGVPAARIVPLVARGDVVELQFWVPPA
jgi:outer membrane protein OmpA-like peptidoglycan-associated protein